MRALGGLVVGALAVVLVGCGDDGGAGGPEAQPAPDVTTFQEGDFSGIPLPPRAEEAGERSERDGVVVQSFFVRDKTPREVLDFYATHFDLQGVTPTMTPQEFGNDAWRGSWQLEGRELLVSATSAPSAGGGDVVTQMSLELSPTDGGGHEGDVPDEADEG